MVIFSMMILHGDFFATSPGGDVTLSSPTRLSQNALKQLQNH
jgi:hypothetical protein